MRGLFGSNDENYVLWFVKKIRSLGGEYIPFRDWDEKPDKITGRRADNLIPQPRNVKELTERQMDTALEKMHIPEEALRIRKELGNAYHRTPGGYLMRIFPKAKHA